MVFCLDRAGIVGDDGPTHHGIFDIAYLRHIPGLICMAPKDENELRHMLYSALSYQCPVSIRYPRGAGLGVPLDETLEILPVGKAEILQQGSQVTLLALGSMVEVAGQVAELLQQTMGIAATIVNARFIKPLDEELIVSCLEQSQVVVTMEEHVLAGGFGSAILELANHCGMDSSKLLRIGIGDDFVPHGKTELLKQLSGLDAAHIVEAIRQHMEKEQV